MPMRKFVVAGLVLVAAGLTVTVSKSLIGQQPAIEEKAAGPVGKRTTATGTTKSATARLEDSDAVQAVSEESRPTAEEGTATAFDPAGATGAGSSTGTSSRSRKGPDKKAKATRSDSDSPLPRGGARAKTSAAGGGGGGPGGGGMQGMGMPGMGMGMGRMPGGMGGAGGMAASVPEDEHLETWVSRALADYARTDDEEARKQQREEIAKALDRIFDIRQERRMAELETLEQRVQKLRETLETRDKLKPEILKNRLDYLIREADGLGWGDGLPVPGRSAPTGIGAGGVDSGSSGSSGTSRSSSAR